MANKDNKGMDLAAAAQQLDVHPKTLRRWCQQQLVPGAWRVGKGHWHIPAEAVEALKGQTV